MLYNTRESYTRMSHGVWELLTPFYNNNSWLKFVKFVNLLCACVNGTFGLVQFSTCSFVYFTVAAALVDH